MIGKIIEKQALLTCQESQLNRNGFVEHPLVSTCTYGWYNASNNRCCPPHAIRFAEYPLVAHACGWYSTMRQTMGAIRLTRVVHNSSLRKCAWYLGFTLFTGHNLAVLAFDVADFGCVLAVAFRVVVCGSCRNGTRRRQRFDGKLRGRGRTSTVSFNRKRGGRKNVFASTSNVTVVRIQNYSRPLNVP